MVGGVRGDLCWLSSLTITCSAIVNNRLHDTRTAQSERLSRESKSTPCIQRDLLLSPSPGISRTPGGYCLSYSLTTVARTVLSIHVGAFADNEYRAVGTSRSFFPRWRAVSRIADSLVEGRACCKGALYL